MKKVVFNSLKIFLLAGLLIMAALFLNNRYQANIVDDRKASEAKPNLKIAVVNGDNGTTLDGEEINLGSNYIKQVENDKENRWSAVQQGAGQKGIDNGDYQLLIEIPADFSQRTFDIDKKNPEAAVVKYTVAKNAQGNARAMAEKVGQKAVFDLNQTLVNMYLVSILDNLYTAQNNVKSVVGNQTKAVRQYQSSVYNPTNELQNVFPRISTMGKTAEQTNEGLQTTLKTISDKNVSLLTSQNDFGKSFQSLIDAHAKGEITDAAFYNAISAVTPSVLGDAVTTEINKLKNANTQVKNELGAATELAPTETNMTKALDDVNNANTTNSALLQTSLGVVLNLEKFKDEYLNYLIDDLKDPSLGYISLQKLIDLNTTSTPTPLAQGLTDLANDVKNRQHDQNQARINALREKIELLPLKLDYPNTILSGLVDFYTSTEIEALIPQITTELGNLNDDLWDTDSTLTQINPSDAGSAGSAGNLRYQLQDLSNHLPAQRSKYDSKSGEVLRQYQEVLNDIIQLSADIQANQITEEMVNDLKNLSVNDELDLAVKNSLLPKLGLDGSTVTFTEPATGTSPETTYTYKLSDFKSSLTGPTATSLNTKISALNAQYTQLQTKNTELNNQINARLNAFSKLQGDYQALLDSENLSKTDRAQVASMMKDNQSGLTSLIAQSEATKADSEAQVAAAKATNAAIDEFNQALADGTQQGASLKTNTTILLGRFNRDDAKNEKFAGDFSKVLKNSRNNGVLNVDLTNHLSNPVAADANTTKKREFVALNPAPWLLVLYGASLFVSYGWTLANALVELLRKHQRDLGWLKMNTELLGINLVSHLLIGLIFAMSTQGQLGIVSEQMPAFFGTILMISLFFGALNGYLVRQFAFAGMGIGMFFLMSETFLMSILNTDATGWLAFVNSINPVAFATRALNGALGNASDDLSAIYIGIAMVVFVGLNLVVFSWTKFAEKMSLNSPQEQTNE